MKLSNRETIYQLFLRKRILTAEQIKESTGIPESSTYRALKDLNRAGLIYFDAHIRSPGASGPRTILWKISTKYLEKIYTEQEKKRI